MSSFSEADTFQQASFGRLYQMLMAFGQARRKIITITTTE